VGGDSDLIGITVPLGAILAFLGVPVAFSVGPVLGVVLLIVLVILAIVLVVRVPQGHRAELGRACLRDTAPFGSIWLGIWWATQTVTTVGYGDVVPQQTAGKAIAVFLMLGGLSFLAVLTGAMTSAFVTRAQAESQETGKDPVVN
jgi:voltage-gated potassium channel Kch